MPAVKLPGDITVVRGIAVLKFAKKNRYVHVFFRILFKIVHLVYLFPTFILPYLDTSPA